MRRAGFNAQTAPLAFFLLHLDPAPVYFLFLFAPHLVYSLY
jgi:hypothetical protein